MTTRLDKLLEIDANDLNPLYFQTSDSNPERYTTAYQRYMEDDPVFTTVMQSRRAVSLGNRITLKDKFDMYHDAKDSNYANLTIIDAMVLAFLYKTNVVIWEIDSATADLSTARRRPEFNIATIFNPLTNRTITDDSRKTWIFLYDLESRNFLFRSKA